MLPNKHRNLSFNIFQHSVPIAVCAFWKGMAPLHTFAFQRLNESALHGRSPGPWSHILASSRITSISCGDFSDQGLGVREINSSVNHTKGGVTDMETSATPPRRQFCTPWDGCSERPSEEPSFGTTRPAAHAAHTFCEARSSPWSFDTSCSWAPSFQARGSR